MTDQEAKRIAVLIESHWPRPEFTDVDVAVMAQAFRSRRVTYDEAKSAVDSVVWAGEKFQPRAPQLFTIIRQARVTSAQERPRLSGGSGGTVPPSEVKKLVARLRGATKHV